MTSFSTRRDGSLIFRLAERTVLFDVRTRSILVEDVVSDPSEADTVYGRPFDTAVCLRVGAHDKRGQLRLELSDGELIDLGGRGRSQEELLKLAWTLGDLLFCRIEVEVSSAPKISEPVYDPYDAPTQKISIPPDLSIDLQAPEISEASDVDDAYSDVDSVIRARIHPSSEPPPNVPLLQGSRRPPRVTQRRRSSARRSVRR